MLASGCQARLALEVTVDAGGAGVLAVTLAADAELRAQARSAGVDPLADLVAAGERLEGEGWSVADVADAGGGRQVTLAVPFAGPDEFETVAADLAGALAAPEIVLLEGLRLEVTEEVVRFEGTAGMVPTAEVAEFGLDSDQAVAVLAAEQPLAYEIAVALEGELLETSAADASVTPLRWVIAPGERVQVLAVAERPRRPLAAAGAGALGLLLVLLAGLALLRHRRRRRRRRIFRGLAS